MLSSPVYVNTEPRSAEFHPRQPVSPAHLASPCFSCSRRLDVRTFGRPDVLSIHPLCFQTLPHSFPQWTTPISFPFNRFHTLSIVMGGGGYPTSKNLNHHFDSSSNSRRISSQSPHFSSFPFKGLRTLSFSVSCKSCICHSYENTRGVYQLFPKRNAEPPCLCDCPVRAGQHESQQRNGGWSSRSDDRKFWRKAKLKRHGQFGADYRVQFNDSRGESRGLPATEESDPVARSAEKSTLRARRGVP
jgi:hypothetical protein